MTEKRAEAPQPPEGYIKSDTDLDNFPVWEFANGPLEGLVMKKKLATVTRKDGKEEDVGLMVVMTKDGEPCLLWESANLAVFFDEVSVDTHIWVNFTGWQNMAGGKRMKLYDAFHR